MKLIEKLCIRPAASGQRIRCSTVDLINGVPVAVAFVFDRTLDPAALARSLALTLEDYPVFAGSFALEQGQWFLDCNARGVQFEVVERNESLGEALHALPATHRKHHVPDVAFGLGRKKCVTHVRLNQLRGGGTLLGIAWQHAIGDWVSFMRFMKAWSDRTGGLVPDPPLIVPDRDQFTHERCDDRHDFANLRVVGFGEMPGMMLRLISSKRRQKIAMLHFTDDEVTAIRAHLQQGSELRLSANDALTSHVMTTINEVEPRAEPRKVTLAMSSRRHSGVGDDVIGNFVGWLTLACEHEVTPVQFAERLRTAIDGWSPRYRSIRAFIDENGGAAKSYRFMADDVDMIEGTALSTLNRTGIFQLAFGGAAPILFFPALIGSLPWYGIVSEGYGGRGLQLGFNMPATVAERLQQPDMQAKLHRFRASTAVLPPAERLPWLV